MYVIELEYFLLIIYKLLIYINKFYFQVKHENGGEEHELEADHIERHNKCEHHHHHHVNEHIHDHNHSHEEDHREHNHHHAHLIENHTNAEHQDHKDQTVCRQALDHQEFAREATEKDTMEQEMPVSHNCSAAELCCGAPHIATEEAVEKLQDRFTQLMAQCADLTEEKQRLEHLVTQLQSETETIGEYIALYQTQRRILKQREYEKAAQTAMLQAEREQMHERLTILNNLVSSLGMELPQKQELNQHINQALAQNVTHNPHNKYSQPPVSNSNREIAEAPDPAANLNSHESQQILHRIQDIITEIKENTKELPTMQDSVDQLNCCSGKFEVV